MKKKLIALLLILCLPLVVLGAGLEGVKLSGVTINRFTYFIRATWDSASNQGYVDTQLLDTAGEGVEDGELVVIEIDGTLAVVSNKMAFTAQGTPIWGDLGLLSQAKTRSVGRGLFGTLNLTDTVLVCGMVWNNSRSVNITGGATDRWGFFIGSDLLKTAFMTASVDVAAIVDNTAYSLAAILGGFDVNGVPDSTGTYGLAFFVEGGIYTTWTRLFQDEEDNTDPLYAVFSNHSANGTLDNFLVPSYDFSAVLQPIALDTFTGSNGDDLGTHAMDVDPDGNDWTEQVGNFEIQSNKAVTTGGAGIVDFDAGIADIVYRAEVTTPGAGTTAGGLVLRGVDYTGATEDYWYIKITPGTAGNDFEIIEYVDGTPTSRAAADVDFAVGTAFLITVITDDEAISAWVDGADGITYGSAATGKTATQHGLRDEGTANLLFDNVVVYPRDCSTCDTEFAKVGY